MRILTKRLGPAEVKCRCILIPRGKKALFPPPGAEFDLLEGKSTHNARLDNQFRLRVVTWFRQHRSLKAGDEVTFSKANGSISIALSRSFSRPESETFDWTHEVLDAVRDREIPGVIRVTRNGFSVEIGEHVEETQIVFATK